MLVRLFFEQVDAFRVQWVKLLFSLVVHLRDSEALFVHLATEIMTLGFARA